MSTTATRVLFQLRTPIDLVDFSHVHANGNQNHLEPGMHELEEIANPVAGTTDAVAWLVLVKDDKATTIGTALPNWEECGEFPTSQ